MVYVLEFTFLYGTYFTRQKLVSNAQVQSGYTLFHALRRLSCGDDWIARMVVKDAAGKSIPYTALMPDIADTVLFIFVKTETGDLTEQPEQTMKFFEK